MEGGAVETFEENGIDVVVDANDFTLFFRVIIALIVITVSLFNMRNLKKWYYRLVYIFLIAVGSVFLVKKLYHYMQWD